MPTPEEIEALTLLVSGASEAADRRRIVGVLERFLGGDRSALGELRPHGISLADHRSQDLALMGRMEAALADSRDPAELSVLAGLRVQMRRWDDALSLYDRLAALHAPTAMEAFLAFQIARIEGRRDRLQGFDQGPLSAVAEAVPEARADLAARWLTMGKPALFARDIRGVRAHADAGEALAQMAERLPDRPHGAGGFRGRHDPGDWARIAAVCSLRCSGGSAVQDFIVDHADARSTAGEYVALSGYMGFRSAHQSRRPLARSIEFARLQLLGLTVPVNRTASRVMRQARADRAAGLTPALIRAIDDSLESEATVRGFLDSLLLGVWRLYLEAAPGLLLMNKMFSGGRFDLFAEMPPFRCLMVWRDPRDQYADQVQRGFCAPGDTRGFIDEFMARVEALKTGLSAASAEHRALFVNVGFEPFVQSQAYRDDLRRRLGLSVDGYRPGRFVAETSLANVGIWRERCSPGEIAVIEAALKPYIDTASIRLEMDGVA